MASSPRPLPSTFARSATATQPRRRRWPSANLVTLLSAVDLERIRILPPGQERVPNPPFYADLEKMGFTGLPNFTTMAAITFDDVVVFHDPLTPQLIFHEMVHVVQYRLLGIEEFARLYVRGYLHGGYDGTPLEVCAYELDGRFIMGSVGFDVEAEVKAWIDRKEVLK